MLTRNHQFRKFKPYVMRYLHSHDPNFEPVLRDLLDHESEVYEELTRRGEKCTRGQRCEQSWQIVFTELAGILTPTQVQQLMERLRADFEETCGILHDMAEGEKMLIGDHGGES